MNSDYLILILTIFVGAAQSKFDCEDFIDRFSKNHACVENRMIASGGSGYVYLVKNTKTNKKEILKASNCSNDERIARFKREFNILKSINHPNVIRLEDQTAAITSDRCVMILERASKGDLKDYILRNRDVSQNHKKILHLFFQIVKGTRAVHEAGIVHSDLKARNIVLTEDEQIKIIDFDLAAPVTSPPADYLKGTHGYMDPRVIESYYDGGEVVYDKNVDVYALGVILYFMVTGSEPFDGDDKESVLNHISQGDYSIPKNVPTDIVFLISHLLSYSVKKRPSTYELMKWIMFIYRNFDSRDQTYKFRSTLNIKNSFPQRALEHMGLTDSSTSSFPSLSSSGLLKQDQKMAAFITQEEFKNLKIDWNSVSLDDDLNAYSRPANNALIGAGQGPRNQKIEKERGCGGFFACFGFRVRSANRNLNLDSVDSSNKMII